MKRTFRNDSWHEASSTINVILLGPQHPPKEASQFTVLFYTLLFSNKLAWKKATKVVYKFKIVMF